MFLFPSEIWRKLIIKNLSDGTVLSKQSGKYAVFLFSYQLGNAGMNYIKDREILYKNLGYKIVITTLDGHDIEDISDIDKDLIKMR